MTSVISCLGSANSYTRATESYLEPLTAAIDELVNTSSSTVENGNSEAIAFHVENQVLAHDGQTNKTNISRHDVYHSPENTA